MRYFRSTAALVAASIPFALADCEKSPLGNTYCNPVKAISFTNFGKAGTFNQVTGMSTGNGPCSSTPQSYSGGMAPLDQEISWHFRGPLNLKQFAYYTPGGDSSKAKRNPIYPSIERRHGHHHDFLHERSDEQREAEKRGVGDMVTATINGQVVSWANQYGGGAAAATAPAASSAPASGSSTGSDARVGASPDSNYQAPSAPSGGWARQSYYNAGNGTAQNLVFLNNMGGGGVSGVFDTTFGLSLSYASSDGTKAAASSQILADTMIADGTEIALFSGKACSGSDCGFYRPGSVAYHGFGGASKLFLLEFSMPKTDAKGFNKDMPAVWILNALIPRTIQYGQEECSCWKSGCGEWDIFEVLESGRQECIATFHGGRSMGESDYFQRPESGTMKAMVMLDGGSGSGSIVVLDEGTSFDTVVGGDTVKGMMGMGGQAKVAVLPN